MNDSGKSELEKKRPNLADSATRSCNPKSSVDGVPAKRVAAVMGILLCGGSSVAIAGLPDAANLAQLDRFLDQQVRQFHLPGLAYAVVDDEGANHLVVRGQGVTRDAAFLIGSCSKTFTALTTLLVLREHNVDLDAPVSEWLPNLTLRGHSRPVTLKELLQHRSGFTRRQGFQTLPTLRELRETPFQLTPANQPGEEFAYSNINYALLGLVVEQVTGESFASAVRRCVFTPLSMNHSTAESRPRDFVAAPEYRCVFGFPWRVASSTPASDRIPAGFLRCSVGDLCKFLTCLLNEGRVNNRQVFPAEVLQQMSKPTTGDVGYGMGLVSGYFAPLGRVVGHEGATATSYATIAVFPERGWGVVFLTNINLFDPFTDAGEAIFEASVRTAAGVPTDRVWPYRIWLRYLILLIVSLSVFRWARSIRRCLRPETTFRPPSVLSDWVGLVSIVAVPWLVWWIALRWSQISFLAVLKLEPDLIGAAVGLTVIGMLRGLLDRCWPAKVSDASAHGTRLAT